MNTSSRMRGTMRGSITIARPRLVIGPMQHIVTVCAGSLISVSMMKDTACLV